MCITHNVNDSLQIIFGLMFKGGKFELPKDKRRIRPFTNYIGTKHSIIGMAKIMYIFNKPKIISIKIRFRIEK